MSIRGQVFLSFFLLIVLSSAALLYLIISDLKPRYRESVEESLADFSFLMAGVLETEKERGGDPAEFLMKTFRRAKAKEIVATIFDYKKRGLGIEGYLTDERGVLQYDSTGYAEIGSDYSSWRDVKSTLAGEYGARTSKDPSSPQSSVMYVAAPIAIGGATQGVFSLGKPTRPLQELMDKSRSRLTVAAVVIGIGAMVIALLLSMVLTQPIVKLTAYARRVAAGERAPLPALGSGEVGALGATFESMRESLEGKKYVEQYVENLTHEIKSPLSAIRGAAELLQEPMPREDQLRFVENIRGESVRLQHLVDKLLMLSSLEARRELKERVEVDVMVLVRSIIESLVPRLAQCRVAIEVRGEGAYVVKGEPFLLEHAIRNIIENGVDFAPADSTVSVTCAVKSGFVTVHVEDVGPGIPEYALDKVFDRFYSLTRPRSEKKSTGLGLSLVKEVVELHGGSVSLQNRPHKGACAVLTLPHSL